MNNKKIQGLLVTKTLRQDKFNRDYLVLKLDNDETIFVFSNQVSLKRWDFLIEGNSYQFTIQEGNQGGNLLVDFS